MENVDDIKSKINAFVWFVLCDKGGIVDLWLHAVKSGEQMSIWVNINVSCTVLSFGWSHCTDKHWLAAFSAY